MVRDGVTDEEWQHKQELCVCVCVREILGTSEKWNASLLHFHQLRSNTWRFNKQWKWTTVKVDVSLMSSCAGSCLTLVSVDLSPDVGSRDQYNEGNFEANVQLEFRDTRSCPVSDPCGPSDEGLQVDISLFRLFKHEYLIMWQKHWSTGTQT